jgi:hypothetical protein
MSIGRRSIRANGIDGIGDLTGMGRALTTTAAGDTTHLVCSTLANLALTIREGAIILLNAGTYEGSERMVTAHDKTTGTLTFVPALAGPPGDAIAFELWEPQVESTANVNAALNRALTGRCHYYKLTPLGMLTNGDCQSITGWTASGTITPVPTAHTFPYHLGRYYFAITNTLAADYLYQTLQVVENRNWEIAVMMRPSTATTVTVKFYDLSNSVYITPSGDTLETELGATATTSVAWRTFRATLTVPDNCKAIRVEVANSVASKVGHLAFLAFWPSDAHELPIPDRVTTENHVGKVFKWNETVDMGPLGTEALQEYTNAWPERLAHGGLSMMFDTAVGGGSFWYQEFTFYEAITADETGETENTTDCDGKYVCYEAADVFASWVASRQAIHHGSEKATVWDNIALRCLAGAASMRKHYDSGPFSVVRTKRRF